MTFQRLDLILADTFERLGIDTGEGRAADETRPAPGQWSEWLQENLWAADREEERDQPPARTKGEESLPRSEWERTATEAAAKFVTEEEPSSTDRQFNGRPVLRLVMGGKGMGRAAPTRVPRAALSSPLQLVGGRDHAASPG